MNTHQSIHLYDWGGTHESLVSYLIRVLCIFNSKCYFWFHLYPFSKCEQGCIFFKLARNIHICEFHNTSYLFDVNLPDLLAREDIFEIEHGTISCFFFFRQYNWRSKAKVWRKVWKKAACWTTNIATYVKNQYRYWLRVYSSRSLATLIKAFFFFFSGGKEVLSLS